jgi:hypothetical protein
MGTIRLGGYKRHHDDLREFKSSLTYHTQEDNGREALVPDKYEPSFQKGLATTKFCSGFMRRQESEVVNDLKVTSYPPSRHILTTYQNTLFPLFLPSFFNENFPAFPQIFRTKKQQPGNSTVPLK